MAMGLDLLAQRGFKHGEEGDSVPVRSLGQGEHLEIPASGQDW